MSNNARFELNLLIFILRIYYCLGWISLQTHQKYFGQKCMKSILLSTTPFESDFYLNPYEDGDPEFMSENTYSSPDTNLVIGLNKYSHDTSICAADAESGKVLFALSKERISRQKHDSGNVASLVETCLNELGLHLENVKCVVMNNHHHRIIPLEKNIRQLEWECGLNINGGVESGYDEPENLLFDASIRHELSHHLAHAYSTASQAPFDKGLCVVMDGMGESFRTMYNALTTNDTTYTSDLSFGLTTFQCIPSNLIEVAKQSSYDWREAESVYVFEKNYSLQTMSLKPIFKRFTPENTPPTLYNHGFENMDSVGAIYSRASSHIFGDWNACGKVMGLAPWIHHSWIERNGGQCIQPTRHETKIMWGKLYSEKIDERFQVDRSLIEGLPHIARTDPDLFDHTGEQKKRYDFDDDEVDNEDKRLPLKVALDAISLADRVQLDLENVVMDFVRHFKKETAEVNLCVAGGVALNSVLNGKLARELDFQETFISPYPGDDGIAIGCCAFGLFGNLHLKHTTEMLRSVTKSPLWKAPLSPYLGPDPSDVEIKNALDKGESWLEIELVENTDQRLQLMAKEIERGAVIAWYRSRSELGPRALGHRSILADPRKKGLVRFINEHVKSRESFRPFAPSVLTEEAGNWFDLGNVSAKNFNVSPYMSMTAFVHKEKRGLIPAVTHVDGSSRLQTVSKENEPLYHELISKFFALTGVPMVLNTSFNTLRSEPIVESPRDAIRSFLYSMGSIEMLCIGDYIVRRKKADLQKLLGQVTKDGFIKSQPTRPKRAGLASVQTSFDLVDDNVNNSQEVVTITKVRMPDRLLHGAKNEWVELLDDLECELLSVCDGTVTVNDIMSQYTSNDDTSNETGTSDIEAQNLLQNIVHRMVRLYEETLIGW